ncbi:DNA-binding response regulator [Clostridiales bacterium]|nr:DNA-binding response regulator [Clostridiales bacterium]
MHTILLIEDDHALNMGLSYALEGEGYQVISAKDLRLGEALLRDSQVDLLLLDGNLPDGDGFTFCKRVKEEHPIPIILLTARDMDQDEIRGFEAGADDYIKKPFSLPVLLKRLEVALRNYGKKKDAEYDDGFLRLDLGIGIAERNGKSLDLTATEFRLLALLLANENQVVTKNIFLEKIWDCQGNFVDEHVVPVNINRLRAKIEDADHKYIKTVYGVGYQWMKGGQT